MTMGPCASAGPLSASAAMAPSTMAMRFMAFPFESYRRTWPNDLPYVSPFCSLTIARIAAAGQRYLCRPICPRLSIRAVTVRDFSMIAVVFEVWPASGRMDDYLAIAATLRAELEQMDGFISVERFQSLTEPGKLLSLSFWRDEDAVRNWRNKEEHRQSQAAGRGGIFADYRLRIAAVVRDYGMAERGQAPEDSR